MLRGLFGKEDAISPHLRGMKLRQHILSKLEPITRMMDDGSHDCSESDKPQSYTVPLIGCTGARGNFIFTTLSSCPVGERARDEATAVPFESWGRGLRRQDGWLMRLSFWAFRLLPLLRLLIFHQLQLVKKLGLPSGGALLNGTISWFVCSVCRWKLLEEVSS